MAAYVKRGDTRVDELCQSKVLTAVRTCYFVADGKCVAGAGTWGVRMAERRVMTAKELYHSGYVDIFSSCGGEVVIAKTR